MPGRKQLLWLLTCSIALISASQPVPAQGPPAPASPGPATPGDAAFAQGRFEQAEAAYAGAIASNPALAGALAGLARKALAASPGQPVATGVMAIADQRRRAFGPERYQITGPTAPATVPFVITDPLPVVKLRVGDREANFMIDTGAPDIMIKQSLADALGLKVTAAGEGVFAGGRRAPVQQTVVPELEIGGIRIRNVPAGVRPAQGGIALPGVEIDGIIGTGLLMHFLSTLDYCGGRLVLAPRRDSAAFEKRAASGQANIVPMWLVGDHFIFARGRLGQAPEAMFHIDTGLAGGGLTANKASLDAAGIMVDESQARTGMGGGGPVRIIPFRADATLGTLSRSNVVGIYSPDGDPMSIFPFRVGGQLSHGFFRQSRLTFDFDAMRLVTESC